MDYSIKIQGCEDDNYHGIFVDGASYAMKYLGITTNIKLNITFCELAKGMSGFIIESECLENFSIFIENTNKTLTEKFLTMFHEIVHVKQYLNDNLIDLLEMKDKPPYQERWWEKEAFDLSKKIALDFELFLTNHSYVDTHNL